MKKKLVLCLLLTTLLAGCGDKVINDNGYEVMKYGRFIEINDTEYKYEDESGNFYNQKLVYDKDTKIVYIYIYRGYGMAISPYYCIDKNGDVVIAIYGENYNGF